MPDRRHVIAAATAAPFFLAAGCADGHRHGGSAPPRTTSAARTLPTSLGEIALDCSPDVASWWGACVQEGAERVARLWGRTRDVLRLTVARDDAEFAQSDASLDAVTAGVTTSSGVMLGPNLKNSLTRPGCVGMVAHELTHARLGHFGSDRTVTWLKEGGAEYTAYRGSGMPLRRLWPSLEDRALTRAIRLDAPPTDADFGHDAAGAYQWAAAYVTYLVEIAGTNSVMALMRARPDRELARARVEAMVGATNTPFDAWLPRALADQLA